MWNRIKDLWEDYGAEIIIGSLILAALSLIALGVYFIEKDSKDWEVFKAQHNCKKIGEIRGTILITSDGKTVSSSNQEQWLCDDGITYTR